MQALSYDGHAINDLANYKTSIEPGGHTPTDVEPGFTPRETGGALVGGATTPARYLVMRTTLHPGSYTKRHLQAQWYHWFRPGARRIGPLVIEDDDGANERFMPVMPISITHEADGDGFVLLTMVAVNDYEMWRSVVEEDEEWFVTGSGQTKVVVNGSEPRNQDAYPVYTLSPTTNKSSGDNLGVFAPVQWRAGWGAVGYSVDVADAALNSAALIAAGKMALDGSDVMVQVDGVYHTPVLGGLNTANTKVWVALDWEPGQAFTLSASRSSGSTSDIAVGESVVAMPNAGIVEIDGELFTYTGRNVSARLLTGVSPGAKGTALAGHSGGATVRWIQHDIQILYGVFLVDIAPEPQRIPMFDYEASTNSSWVFANFADPDNESRPGQWRFGPAVNALAYGGNQGATAIPRAELGMVSSAAKAVSYSAAHTLWNPCGITAVNFANGERYHASKTGGWSAAVRSSIDGNTWTVQYAIPKPTAANTWQSWNHNASSLPAGTLQVQLYMAGEATATKVRYLECSDVTVTLDNTKTPTVTLGEEAVGYPLRATLANLTTGENIVVAFNMPLGTELEVDTDQLRVTHLENGSNQYRAVTPNGARDTMLRLAPGSNTLKFTDESTGLVTIGIRWRKQWIN